MKFWFITDTPRLAKERSAVEGLSAEAGWFSLKRWCLFEGRFCAEGVIRAHHKEYPVRLIYPDQFPQVPAWVEPQDAKAKWSSHQYGEGGTLCLELRPDTWKETATGADVLTSAFRLLEIENPLGEENERARAPSAHGVGALQSYDWLSTPLFVTAGCLERIRAGASCELKSGYSAYLDELLPVFVHDELDRSAAQYPPTDGRGFSEMPAYVSKNAAPPSTPGSRDDLRSAAALAEDADAGLAVAQFALVLFAGGEGLSAFQMIGDGPPLRLSIVVVPDSNGHRSGRAPEAAKK